MAFKLNYKLGDRRTVSAGPDLIDVVPVEWTHAGGPVADTVEVPVTHPPDVQFETRPAGARTVIHDEVRVKHGAPDSVVMQICEEKRPKLAANLGVEP